MTEFASTLPHVERLAERGNQLRMPASRSLGEGLFELRFDLTRVAWRLTYFFASDWRIALLTVFRRQRQNERHDVQRAHLAMAAAVLTVMSPASATRRNRARSAATQLSRDARPPTRRQTTG